MNCLSVVVWIVKQLFLAGSLCKLNLWPVHTRGNIGARTVKQERLWTLHAYLLYCFPGNVLWYQFFCLRSMGFGGINNEQTFCVSPTCNNYNTWFANRTRMLQILSMTKYAKKVQGASLLPTCWFDQRFQVLHALSVDLAGIGSSGDSVKAHRQGLRQSVVVQKSKRKHAHTCNSMLTRVQEEMFHHQLLFGRHTS